MAVGIAAELKARVGLGASFDDVFIKLVAPPVRLNREEAMSRSDGPAAPSAITAERSALWALESFVTQTFAVAAAEVKKLRHDPLELFTRAVQPVLWLMLFGEVMAACAGGARQYSLSRFPGRRHSGAERAVRGDLLRHLGDLGTRSRRVAALSGEPGAAGGAGARQSAVGRRARAVAGAERLPARARRRHRPCPAQYPRRRRGNRARLGPVGHAAADHRLHRQDA